MTNDKFIEKTIEKFSKHIAEQLKDAEKFKIISEDANIIYFKYYDKINRRTESGYIRINVFT